MSHDDPATGLHRDFQDELILRIVQLRAPEEMHLPVLAHSAEGVHEVVHGLAAQSERVGLALQHGLVFHYQGYRENGRELTLFYEAEQAEGCPPPRS